VDELGYMNLKPEHANALFQLLEQRYDRKRTLITTNLDFDQWYDLFRNKPLVDALLDRTAIGALLGPLPTSHGSHPLRTRGVCYSY
jgi:DNA replication protein DnaC